jgi:hypothetical protein
LFLPGVEECVGSHEESAHSSLSEGCEGGIDFAWAARLEGFDLHSNGVGRIL